MAAEAGSLTQSRSRARRLDVFRFALDMRGALYQCGRVSVALQRRVSPEAKVPDSPHQMSTAVSVVDRLCQEIVLLRAYELAPGLEMHSEEVADCPTEILELYAANSHRYALILDPVDGTDEYLAGGPRYAHMLGLLDQGSRRMACGMIYFPSLGRLYLAVRGSGALVAEGLWGPLRALSPAVPPRTVEDVKRLQWSDYAAFGRLGWSLAPPESASAAHELTRVTEGRLGAMVMRHFHGHDTAISSVFIEELGGLVLDHEGLPVTYEKAMPRMPLVISALAPGAARDLYEALRDDAQ